MKALINEIREYLNQELEIVKTQSKLEVANYINDSFNSTEKDSKSVHVLNDRLSIQLSKLRKFTTITCEAYKITEDYFIDCINQYTEVLSDG